MGDLPKCHFILKMNSSKKIRTSALIFIETLELSKAICRVDIVATQEKRLVRVEGLAEGRALVGKGGES